MPMPVKYICEKFNAFFRKHEGFAPLLKIIKTKRFSIQVNSRNKKGYKENKEDYTKASSHRSILG
jgi:hypothetical protein